MYLLLSHFDNVLGPKIFKSLPEKLERDLEKEVLEYMKINVEKGFIVGISSSPDKKIKIINYLFEVPSKLARGNNETLMISLIVEKNYRVEMFQEKLKELGNEIINTPNIYKAFYQKTIKNSPDKGISNAITRLDEILSAFFKIISKLIDNPDLGDFLIIGISKVGKSTIIHYLKSKVYNPDIKPTLALKVIRMILNDNIFKIIDVSGQKRLRFQWWTYTKKPTAIIFVIDINDSIKHLKESKKELFKVKNHLFNEYDKLPQDVPILICLNKIDLFSNYKQKESEIYELLNLENLNLNYKVQLTSAKTGQGIQEGCTWIFQELLKIH